ncbi:hypothetical protein [Candidatus Poriferisodalis sp.]|uniref:hypothetical protein n=1 Tax=Candidatus Poriferisodalis sp. TaxID=3101277 RepID=UPI003B02D3BB
MPAVSDTAADAVPAPAEFTARTLNSIVPLPDTSNDVVDAPEPVTSSHDVPLLPNAYWYFVIVESSGSSQNTLTPPTVGTISTADGAAGTDEP